MKKNKADSYRVSVTAGKGGRMRKLVVNTEARDQFEAVELAAVAVKDHRPSAPTTLLFHVSKNVVGVVDEVTL